MQTFQNTSEYDYSMPGGWVDSEFEHRRFRGYRPPGYHFDSYVSIFISVMEIFKLSVWSLMKLYGYSTGTLLSLSCR